MKKGVILLSLCFLLTSCAAYRPIVDLKGVDRDKYAQDLKECRQYAEEVNFATETATAALMGAALGAAVGALSGGNAAAAGAALGAVTGVSAGDTSATNAKKTSRQYLPERSRLQGVTLTPAIE